MRKMQSCVQVAILLAGVAMVGQLSGCKDSEKAPSKKAAPAPAPRPVAAKPRKMPGVQYHIAGRKEAPRKLHDYIGIFEVARFTRNGAACDAEGPTAENRPGWQYMIVGYNAGLLVQPCRDLKSCKAQVKEHRGPVMDYEFGLDPGKELVGKRIELVHKPKERVCVGTVARVRLDKDGAGLKLTSRVVAVRVRQRPKSPVRPRARPSRQRASRVGPSRSSV